MPAFVSETKRVDQLKNQVDFNNYLARVTWRGSSLLREKQGDVIRMSPLQAIIHKIIICVVEKITGFKKGDDYIDGTQKLAVKKCVTRLLEKGTQNQWISSNNVEKAKKIATDAGLCVVIDLTETPNILKIEDPQKVDCGWEVKINNESLVEYRNCHHELGSYVVQDYSYDPEKLVLALDVQGAQNSDFVYFYFDPKIKSTKIPQRHIYVKSAPPTTIGRGIVESNLKFVFDFKDKKYQDFLNGVSSNVFELYVHGAIGVHKFIIDKSLAVRPLPEVTHVI